MADSFVSEIDVGTSTAGAGVSSEGLTEELDSTGSVDTLSAAL